MLATDLHPAQGSASWLGLVYIRSKRSDLGDLTTAFGYGGSPSSITSYKERDISETNLFANYWCYRLRKFLEKLVSWEFVLGRGPNNITRHHFIMSSYRPTSYSITSPRGSGMSGTASNKVMCDGLEGCSSRPGIVTCQFFYEAKSSHTLLAYLRCEPIDGDTGSLSRPD